MCVIRSVLAGGAYQSTRWAKERGNSAHDTPRIPSSTSPLLSDRIRSRRRRERNTHSAAPKTPRNSFFFFPSFWERENDPCCYWNAVKCNGPEFLSLLPRLLRPRGRVGGRWQLEDLLLHIRIPNIIFSQLFHGCCCCCCRCRCSLLAEILEALATRTATTRSSIYNTTVAFLHLGLRNKTTVLDLTWQSAHTTASSWMF